MDSKYKAERRWSQGSFDSVQEAHAYTREERAECLRYQRRGYQDYKRVVSKTMPNPVWRAEFVRSKKRNVRKRLRKCRAAYYINAHGGYGGGYDRSKRRHKDASVAKVLSDGTLVWL